MSDGKKVIISPHVAEEIAAILHVPVKQVMDLTGGENTFTRTFHFNPLSPTALAEAVNATVLAQEVIQLAVRQWCCDDSTPQRGMIHLPESVSGFAGFDANRFMLQPRYEVEVVEMVDSRPVYAQLMRLGGWDTHGRPLDDEPGLEPLSQELRKKIVDAVQTQYLNVVGWNVYPAPNLILAEEVIVRSVLDQVRNRLIDLQCVLQWMKRTLESYWDHDIDKPVQTIKDQPTDIINLFPKHFMEFIGSDVEKHILPSLIAVLETWEDILKQQKALVLESLNRWQLVITWEAAANQAGVALEQHKMYMAQATAQNLQSRFTAPGRAKAQYQKWVYTLVGKVGDLPTYEQALAFDPTKAESVQEEMLPDEETLEGDAKDEELVQGD